MSSLPPTVIRLFLDEVFDQLRAIEWDGAAASVAQSAEIFEPTNRAADREAEYQQLILFGEMVTTRWIERARSFAVDRSVFISSSPVRHIEIREDAGPAAAKVREIADSITLEPASPVASDLTTLRDSLVHIASALDELAGCEPTFPAQAAEKMMPPAVNALLSLMEIGAIGDLPVEVRTIVNALDRMDPDLTLIEGTPGIEKTSKESETHKTLVDVLVSDLAMKFGKVTHGDNVGTLQRPPKIGRHRPDVIAVDEFGGTVIGEAKTGPDLTSDHSKEQIEDFLLVASETEGLALRLAVPKGWKGNAETVANDVSDHTDKLTVLEVDIPGVPGPS